MRVGIIGGGPAGMMAAIEAAKCGNTVTLFEKNEKLGKKLYITGKGRCNITNDILPNDFLLNVVSNPKFLFSSIYNFTPYDTEDYFKNLGVDLTVERGGRVFPTSNKSSDFIKAFTKDLEKHNVTVKLNSKVNKIITKDNRVVGLEVNNEIFDFEKVIISTGGLSYPLTGSTGDGYTFSRKLGHTVIDTAPALVPINLTSKAVSKLAGLSLKNVSLSVYTKDNRLISTKFGEMLFTHTGISGPIVISTSSLINRLDLKGMYVSIDLKPALDEEKLDNRILRDFEELKNKDFKNSLNKLLPKSLIPVIIELSNIDENKKINQISTEERLRLVKLLKDLRFNISSLGGYNEAIVTAGGVNTKEINPKTMESKIIKNLFFAGEVIDVDAYTGGYNIQIALSTGVLAGHND